MIPDNRRVVNDQYVIPQNSNLVFYSCSICGCLSSGGRKYIEGRRGLWCNRYDASPSSPQNTRSGSTYPLDSGGFVRRAEGLARQVAGRVGGKSPCARLLERMSDLVVSGRGLSCGAPMSLPLVFRMNRDAGYTARNPNLFACVSWPAPIKNPRTCTCQSLV